MRSLLEDEAPGLAKRLESVSLETRRHIVGRACIVASEFIDSSSPEMRALLETLRKNGKLSADQVANAGSLAAAADAEYFLLQGRDAERQRALMHFSRARLLTAISLAFGDARPENSSDAVYELCKSCDNPRMVLDSVESDLNKID